MVEKITEINKETIYDLKDDVVEQLRAWASDRGLVASYVGADFDRNMATMKIGLTIQRFDKDGKKLDADESNFIAYCDRFGFKEENLHDEVIVDGSPYKIVGIAPRQRKKPIIVVHTTTGDRMRMAPTKILDYYKIKEKEAAEKAVVDKRKGSLATPASVPGVDVKVDGLGEGW